MRKAMLIVGIVLVGFAVAAVAAPPATAPIRPSTRRSKEPPKQHVSLMNGAVKFVVPEEWTESDRTEDGKNVKFTSPDGVCTMMIGVVPQEYPVPVHNDNFREKIKVYLITNMKKAFQDGGIEILYGPKSETDDRFYQRIHDTIKQGDETMDEVHLYRAAGLDLLLVTTVVKSDQKAVAKPFHTIGEDTCLSMVLGVADKKK